MPNVGVTIYVPVEMYMRLKGEENMSETVRGLLREYLAKGEQNADTPSV